ncbi:hypothetical protein Lesp02_29370 [Lentzea sp. NBRC 105346]|uniref:DUF5819 family protein n=1 Tax=Lentzea sp. NBRC 105346 TaxID=3032205 RepID=UPI0024A03350|nr:DUF5819 family protein [Lentzea sp. NBRC 105346]GLZ30748.1 hypothetical protein Lesp02_29370 [Lentzea sp. NBRC 105346]
MKLRRTAVALFALVAVVHVVLIFVHTAPFRLPLRAAANSYADPYFRQDWGLFAPDPGTENQAVVARLELADGTITPWVDLTAEDLEAVRHSLLPGQVPQVQLDYALGYYNDTHREGAIPEDARATEIYLGNIVLHRLAPRYPTPAVAVQVKAVYTRVVLSGAPPPSEEVELPWWRVG